MFSSVWILWSEWTEMDWGAYKDIPRHAPSYHIDLAIVTILSSLAMLAHTISRRVKEKESREYMSWLEKDAVREEWDERTKIKIEESRRGSNRRRRRRVVWRGDSIPHGIYHSTTVSTYIYTYTYRDPWSGW